MFVIRLRFSQFQISPVKETENGHRLHSLSVDSFLQIMQGGFGTLMAVIISEDWIKVNVCLGRGGAHRWTRIWVPPWTCG